MLDELETDLRVCIPPTPTPNPGEQAWLEFEEWFRSTRDSLVYLDIIPRLSECSLIPPDEYFGTFVSANNLLHNDGISYGGVVDVKFWESRYRIDGEDPSEFRALITGMVEEIEDAVRDACIDAMKALSPPLSPTEAPMPPTVGRSEPRAAEPTLVPTSEPLTFTFVTSGHSFSCGIVSGRLSCLLGRQQGRSGNSTVGIFLVHQREHIAHLRSESGQHHRLLGRSRPSLRRATVWFLQVRERRRPTRLRSNERRLGPLLGP